MQHEILLGLLLNQTLHYFCNTRTIVCTSRRIRLLLRDTLPALLLECVDVVDWEMLAERHAARDLFHYAF